MDVVKKTFGELVEGDSIYFVTRKSTEVQSGVVVDPPKTLLTSWRNGDIMREIEFTYLVSNSDKLHYFCAVTFDNEDLEKESSAYFINGSLFHCSDASADVVVFTDETSAYEFISAFLPVDIRMLKEEISNLSDKLSKLEAANKTISEKLGEVECVLRF
jgi:hypothetical protein